MRSFWFVLSWNNHSQSRAFSRLPAFCHNLGSFTQSENCSPNYSPSFHVWVLCRKNILNATISLKALKLAIVTIMVCSSWSTFCMRIKIARRSSPHVHLESLMLNFHNMGNLTTSLLTESYYCPILPCIFTTDLPPNLLKHLKPGCYFWWRVCGQSQWQSQQVF